MEANSAILSKVMAQAVHAPELLSTVSTNALVTGAGDHVAHHNIPPLASKGNQTEHQQQHDQIINVSPERAPSMKLVLHPDAIKR